MDIHTALDMDGTGTGVAPPQLTTLLATSAELAAAATCLTALAQRGWRLATAESCTGGLVGALLSAHAGSSRVFIGGVVAYADEVKRAMLDVPTSMLEQHGAVSEHVARAMAVGVRARLGADVAVSITGIAGPGGARPGKPVGCVWIGCSSPAGLSARAWRFKGDRAAVRRAAALRALEAATMAARSESVGS
jgi:PncC family amidohydrolase